MTIVINNIKLPINASFEEAFSVAKRKMLSVGLNLRSPEYRIYRRSVDARNKNDIKFVYSVAVSSDTDKISDELVSKLGASRLDDSTPTVDIGNTPLDAPPVVVGSGPAGLFASLMLAEHGYSPILIERGGSVDERRAAVERFSTLHVLDTECNIQFGAGGAGTFSDGKLVTRVNDPLGTYVLERFIEFGAPEEIRYIAKPHIGTDVLSLVVENMLARIVELGGRVEYHTKFLSASFVNNKIHAINTNKGAIPAGALILAIGHSARDTYEYLLSTDISIQPKAFSVGMRIEHLASDIDNALYGKFAGDPRLGHAEYNLAYDTKGRGVYTFCMCPGGEVVASSSEEFGVAVNGMSYHSRSGKNSNCAVLCSIFTEDYGKTPKSAIEFQRKIERAAFAAGGGEYSAPIITVGDFLSDGCSHEPRRIMPTYMQGNNVKLARPEEYLPSVVTDQIKSGISAFDKKIHGFAASDAVLTGAETRTSAPLRILRDPDTHLAVGYDNLYPAGEGAGYAGGITSASIDGIKTAIALMKKFAN